MKKAKMVSLLLSLVFLVSCNDTPISSDTSSSISSPSSSESEVSSSQGDSESTSSSSSSPESTSSSEISSSSQESSQTSSDSSEPISSTSPDEPDSSTSEPEEIIKGAISGAEDIEIPTGHYFDAFEGVKAYDENGVNLTSVISCKGTVDYGTPGTYVLTYSAEKEGVSLTKTRTVTVSDSATYTAPVNNKKYLTSKTVQLSNGSYQVGPNDAVPNPTTPSHINPDLLEQPVPTNTWYSGLFVSPSGTGLYINQYRIVASDGSFGLSDVGIGGDQIYRTNKDMADGGSQKTKTLSNFTPFFTDVSLSLATASLQNMQVMSYSENGLKLTWKDSSEKDTMVATIAQGSPNVFFETNGVQEMILNLSQDGVTGGYHYYSLAGQEITSQDSITDEGIVFEIRSRHRGYAYSDNNTPGGTSFGAPIYKSIYFLVNAPQNTTFTMRHGSHPDATMKDQLSIVPSAGNYISITPMGEMYSTAQAQFYHQHGYAMIGRANSSFEVNHNTDEVITTFENNVQRLDGSDETAVLGLYPHQWKKTDSTLSPYYVEGMRGTIKMLAADSFSTEMSFRGILPSFTLPTASTFDRTTMVSYLKKLDSALVSDGTYDSEVDDKDYLDNTAPYWNSKALYPLSQGLIIADQLSESTLKQSFIDKIELVLTDWFTYSGTEDKRFLYYNDTWGSLYYSDDTFSTGSRLTDHHFTHGYLIYASAVLAMYDPTYFAKYKDMMLLLLKDYMCYDKSDTNKFPYLRTFDTYCGHSWSDGFGNFLDGNNQESCGEALNSWVAGYLLGIALNDSELVDTAIYGFTSEIYGAKQYWFDYDENNWYGKNIPAEANIHGLGMIWGGKNEYQTWFGPSPEFMYGIQWLPTGEYLTSYALGTSEQTMLTKIYNTFLAERGGAPKTWYTNMWSIQSLCSAETAMNNFDETKILGDEYPNELSGCYWMIQSMATLKNHSATSYAEVDSSVAFSVYDDGTTERILLWNPSSTDKNVIVHYGSDQTKTVTAVHGFTSVTL